MEILFLTIIDRSCYGIEKIVKLKAITKHNEALINMIFMQ